MNFAARGEAGEGFTRTRCARREDVEAARGAHSERDEETGHHHQTGGRMERGWGGEAAKGGERSKHTSRGLRHECNLAGSVGMCVGDRDLHGKGHLLKYL